MRHSTTSKLDKTLINSLKQYGAEVINHGNRREPLYSVKMSFRDKAHLKFIEAVCPNGDNLESIDDPLLYAGPVPLGGGVIPMPAQIGSILMEIGGILTAYQNLLAGDFVGPPPAIGPPLMIALPGIPYHHATVTAHKVADRISNPGPACPLIHALPVGCLICDLMYHYANANVVIRIPRT